MCSLPRSAALYCGRGRARRRRVIDGIQAIHPGWAEEKWAGAAAVPTHKGEARAGLAQ